MSFMSITTSLEVNLQPGKPAILNVDPKGGALDWIGKHEAQIRAIVAQHGAVLVRDSHCGMPPKWVKPLRVSVRA